MREEYNKFINQEVAFLNTFGDYGISFYKASDSNLSNWNKLELNENNNNSINTTTCV